MLYMRRCLRLDQVGQRPLTTINNARRSARSRLPFSSGLSNKTRRRSQARPRHPSSLVSEELFSCLYSERRVRVEFSLRSQRWYSSGSNRVQQDVSRMTGLRFASRLSLLTTWPSVLVDRNVRFCPSTPYLPNRFVSVYRSLTQQHLLRPGDNTYARTFQMAFASRTRSVSAGAAEGSGLRASRPVYAKVCREDSHVYAKCLFVHVDYPNGHPPPKRAGCDRPVHKSCLGDDVRR